MSAGLAPGRRSSALGLALAYAALVVYASLFPFEGWRSQGLAPWAFLGAPYSPYWTGFDVSSNFLGYVPLGFLLALGLLRGGQTPWRAALWAAIATVFLSLSLECLQSYLPRRVPSKLDWLLNGGGGISGALLAVLLERLGAVAQWSRFRARWFSEDAGAAIALLLLWPWALLFPQPIAFGLGQVIEQIEEGLGALLQDTPFIEWLPLRTVELQPILPIAEVLVVALGLLAPVLLAYSVMQVVWRRAVSAGLIMLAGVLVTLLSAALSFSPKHATDWLDLPVRVGIWCAVVVAALLCWVPRRAAAALLLLVLALQLSLLNDASVDLYFFQTLQVWEQGRFIRFHGLGQWLGWIWPYAVLILALLRLSRREHKSTMTA